MTSGLFPPRHHQTFEVSVCSIPLRRWKLKNTYCTPLTEWGDDLRLVVCQIARWFLILRRGLDKGQDFEVYKPVDAFLWLEETGKGYNQAAVKETGTGFVFADWMVARAPFRTGWRF